MPTPFGDLIVTVSPPSALFQPFRLPNGTVLKNRIVKSAMSDSLGDGRGRPTPAQIRLYERWAEGGAAATIVGEVQADPRFAENAGNLVLRSSSDLGSFAELARRGRKNGTQIWLQLGNAGALTPPAIGTPKGPSAIRLPDLQAEALRPDEIAALPDRFARTAVLAEDAGFDGVQIHAAHGFLLSQFLSPLFNRRSDAYGGTIANRMRPLVDAVAAVRARVSARFTVALKLNSSDLLEGGLCPEDALSVVDALNGHGLDLIDISGGTYFPGAPSSSERVQSGPYFLQFAAAARRLTATPIMTTGGFKRRSEAEMAVAHGTVDLVGLARALVLEPDLPTVWRDDGPDPVFPRFPEAPPGAVTAWFTMRLEEIGEDRSRHALPDATAALDRYRERDSARVPLWGAAFSTGCRG